ncbi:MAG: GNAT family N-acetyltransferase [Candidatus Baltobacteraceae bacterium]
MSAPTVRHAAGAADRAFIERCGVESLGSSLSPLRDAPMEALRTNFLRLLDIVHSRSNAILIAADGELRLGFALLVFDLPDEVSGIAQAFLAYMAVEVGQRGHGIGALLLEACEEEACRVGIPYLALMVTEGNSAAQRLYERAGYRTERRLLGKKL